MSEILLIGVKLSEVCYSFSFSFSNRFYFRGIKENNRVGCLMFLFEFLYKDFLYMCIFFIYRERKRYFIEFLWVGEWYRLFLILSRIIS